MHSPPCTVCAAWSERHTDPGLLTVLARGTAPGLELELRDVSTAMPCCSRNSSYKDVIAAETANTNGGAGSTAAVPAGGVGSNMPISLPHGAPQPEAQQERIADADADADEDEEAGATKGKGRGRQWLLLEPVMKPNQVVVLVGETLARATGGQHPAGLHRVVRPKGLNTPRFNMAYELRPFKGVFHSLVPDGNGSTAEPVGNQGDVGRGGTGSE